MSQTLKRTNFKFEGQSGLYHGKVRDVYSIGDELLVMIASDRISAFDVILPEAIPYKGQVLNQIASKFLAATEDIVPNWVQAVPDPNVSIGWKCEPIPIEMVIRGYLAGHAWREYRSGKRLLCGVELPEGLKENDALPNPVITPATKEEEGHDEDISRAEILARGIVREEIYLQLENYTRALFERGSEMAAQRGLILVDTKYEFGLKDGKVYLMDEIHTPDSSRYFYADGYAARQQRGEKQKQLSKEFVRQWLIEQGFQGLQGQQVPEMRPEVVNSISERYIELYEQITGEAFVRSPETDIARRVENNIRDFLSKMPA